MKPGFLSIFLMGLAVILLFSIGVAMTAANSVSTSGLALQTVNITADQMKPPECAGLALTTIVAYPAPASGAANLVLGTSAGETISSLGGNDCILGGSGDDDLLGGNGTDILLGGLGNDTLRGGTSADNLYGGDGNDTLLGGGGNDFLDGGAGIDVCTGNGGTDTYAASCETILP